MQILPVTTGCNLHCVAVLSQCPAVPRTERQSSRSEHSHRNKRMDIKQKSSFFFLLGNTQHSTDTKSLKEVYPEPQRSQNQLPCRAGSAG